MPHYPPGTVLKINCGTFWHYGISDGDGGVIHNSRKRGKVMPDTLEEFAEGRDIKVSHIQGSDMPAALEMAKTLLGTKYNVFSENCEHFVRLVHGLEKESTQIQQYILAAVGAGTALLTKNEMLKAAGRAVAITSLLTPAEKRPFRNAAVAACIAVSSTYYKQRKAAKRLKKAEKAVQEDEPLLLEYHESP